MAKENIAAANQKEKLYYGNYAAALFSALDIAVEGKDAGEVALNFGKAALSNSISAGLGAAAKGLSGLADKIGSAAGRTAVKAGIAGGSAYITKVSNSYISSVDYSAESGWTMDWEKANSSWYSKETIAATLGAGISAGMTAGLNEANLFDSNKTALNSRTFNTDAISKFNSLAGGLSSSAVSFAITGEVTFNVLNLTDFGTKINGGLLELTYNKDKGFSSRIGNGGTDISASNLVSSISGINSLHKNRQINKTGYDRQTLDALRTQWGFGDKTARNQLNEIIKGEAILQFDADGTETAQSIAENGQKAIHINSSLNDDFIDVGLALQHEAYRDGIITDSKSQFAETANAVAGHTQMALAMLDDSLYANEMLNHIYSDINLQNDINAYLYAAYTGNIGTYAGYVGANYDSSADYWKMTWGGQLVSDGSGWLKDENGMYISRDGARTEKPIQGETLGAAYQEAGLLNIMAGTSGERWSSFTEEEQQQAQQIMKGSGLVMDKNGQWNYAKGKKLDMADIMAAAGESIANPVFETYYNNKVDYDLATAWNMDLRFSETAMNKTVPESLQGRYSELITQHLQETDSPEALKDKYTWNIYNKEGIATELFRIDENNSFLDDLLGQHDFKNLNNSIDRWGCNFMTIISYSQLLIGNTFNENQVLDVWNKSISLGYINENDAMIQNRNKVSFLASKMLGLDDMYITFDDTKYTENYTHIGNRLNWLYSNGNPYHFTNGSIYNSNIYNPGYTIKPNYNITPVSLWW